MLELIKLTEQGYTLKRWQQKEHFFGFSGDEDVRTAGEKVSPRQRDETRGEIFGINNPEYGERSSSLEIRQYRQRHK